MTSLYDGFTEWYLRHVAGRVVSVAECAKRYLVSVGVAAEKIVVIHNGIPNINDEERIEDLRRDLGLPVDALVIGVVSRLEPIKNDEMETFNALSNIKDEMERLGGTLWVPIISQKELTGIIFLGYPKYGLG